jgi:glycosyltransferase involved in cell wall biosynthesis
MAEAFDVVASESGNRRFIRKWATKAARRILPSFDARLSFYDDLDALIYIVQHEWDVIREVYELPQERGHITPHGLDPYALEALGASQTEEDYIVSVGTICSRKNSILLARCAQMAKVPIVFVGKPLSENDPYFQAFLQTVDDRFVRSTGYVSEATIFEILRGARGFSLLSKGESGCIALYEVAAAGLPLLLSDPPWAAKGYPKSNRLHLVSLNSASAISSSLKEFYNNAHRGRNMTFPVGTWADIARQYLQIYNSL